MTSPANPSWLVTGASTRGASHHRAGTPNQDAFAYWLQESGGNQAILAVSDGHGADQHFRSQIGSRLAVEAAVSLLPGWIADPNPDPEELPRQLVAAWLRTVERHLEENPFTPEELGALGHRDGNEPGASDKLLLAYGATLLVVVATEEYMEYMQLGDGDILTVDQEGVTTRPLPLDERLIANQTTSLCQTEAWREFRRLRQSCLESPPPALTLVSTDGYANSFRSEADFLMIGRDYLDLVRRNRLDDVGRELPDILSEASERGSGDDITLGILLRPSALGKAVTGIPQQEAREGDPIGGEATAGQPAARLPARPEVRARRPSSASLALSFVSLFLALAAVHVWWPSQDSMPGSDASPLTAPVASSPEPEQKAPLAALPQPANWVLVLKSGVQVLLEPGLIIRLNDLVTSGKADAGEFAEVVEAGARVRLKNLSHADWQLVSKDGGQRRIRPGEVMDIGKGEEVDFGWTRASIQHLSELEGSSKNRLLQGEARVGGQLDAVDLGGAQGGSPNSGKPR